MSGFARTQARLDAALASVLASSLPISDCVQRIQEALLPEGDKAEGMGEPRADESDRAVLELVMRTQLDRILGQSKAPGESIESAGVPRLLDLAIALASGAVSDPNTPFALLEDLFDANVVSAAEDAFRLVEARAGALAQFLTGDPKHQKSKLTLIRSCNELLRRLSKSKNTNFRGRVLMFMAYTFPLAERSGVNLKGTTAVSSVEVEPENASEDVMNVDMGGSTGNEGGA